MFGGKSVELLHVDYQGDAADDRSEHFGWVGIAGQLKAGEHSFEGSYLQGPESGGVGGQLGLDGLVVVAQSREFGVEGVAGVAEFPDRREGRVVFYRGGESE